MKKNGCCGIDGLPGSVAVAFKSELGKWDRNDCDSNRLIVSLPAVPALTRGFLNEAPAGL